MESRPTLHVVTKIIFLLWEVNLVANVISWTNHALLTEACSDASNAEIIVIIWDLHAITITFLREHDEAT